MGVPEDNRQEESRIRKYGTDITLESLFLLPCNRRSNREDAGYPNIDDLGN